SQAIGTQIGIASATVAILGAGGATTSASGTLLVADPTAVPDPDRVDRSNLHGLHGHEDPWRVLASARHGPGPAARGASLRGPGPPGPRGPVRAAEDPDLLPIPLRPHEPRRPATRGYAAQGEPDPQEPLVPDGRNRVPVDRPLLALRGEHGKGEPA